MSAKFMAAVMVGLFATAGSGAEPADPTTFIIGAVRDPATKKPIAGAKISSDGTSYTSSTDGNGRFVIETLRSSTTLRVGKDGFLEVEYPLLSLSADTVQAEVELRTDPPGEVSLATSGHLKMLCIVDVNPRRLQILNTCEGMALEQFETRVIKHNPWSPYFGPAGDRGGVLWVTRR